MPSSRPLGFLCTCGAVIAIPGIQLEEGEVLQGKQNRLMLDGWQMIAVHPGCPRRGIGKVLSAFDLLMVPSSE
jgi:hypothetical protein